MFVTYQTMGQFALKATEKLKMCFQKPMLRQKRDAYKIQMKKLCCQ